MGAALLLVAGCSGGGGKSSTPTTANATTTANPGAGQSYPAPVQPPSVIAKLGPCPTHFPTATLARLNANLAGLDNKLVPIAALSVRLCRYNGWHTPVTGTVVLNGVAARRLEDVANALPMRRGRGCPVDRLYLLTFADERERVVVEQATDLKEPPDCNIGPTNGTWGGLVSTPAWLEELGRDTGSNAPTMPTGPVSPAPTGAG